MCPSRAHLLLLGPLNSLLHRKHALRAYTYIQGGAKGGLRLFVWELRNSVPLALTAVNLFCPTLFALLPPSSVVLHLTHVQSFCKIPFKCHLFGEASPGFIMQSCAGAQDSKCLSAGALAKLGSERSGHSALVLRYSREQRS